MVRLETCTIKENVDLLMKFTFQYGQIRNKNTAPIRKFYRLIYIPVWLDQKPIIDSSSVKVKAGFTFQYGQIRNTKALLKSSL